MRLYNSVVEINNSVKINNALAVESVYRYRLSICKNPFARRYARKYFSQTDEDGITLEIVKRIRLKNPGFGNFFIEFGVGNGCENNTLVLLSLGWHGSWFGNQELAFSTENSCSLRFRNSWITKDNINNLYHEALSYYPAADFDVVSLDLDGNDYYFIESLLSNNRLPPLFICEYNAVFPFGANWKISYDDNHRWKGDQYFGASIGSFINLFAKHDYFLVACNPHTGANAFFVRNEYRDLLPDIPENVEDICAAPFYRLDNKFSHNVTGIYKEFI